jgi:hypothetical protein
LPLQLLDLDPHDPAGISLQRGARGSIAQLRAEHDEIGRDQRAGCLEDVDIARGPFGEELLNVLVQGIVLGVALVSQTKGSWFRAGLEEGIS